jgi:hypothetical protein
MGLLGMEDELHIGPFRLRLQESSVPLFIPGDDRDFRELTPADEFEIAAMSHPDSPHQVLANQPSWPEDADQVQVLKAVDRQQGTKPLSSMPSDPSTPVRLATSLLEDSDSSVFRIPIKAGTH